MSRPIDIDTSDWGPFDPNSATDAMCERERVAFTEYTLKRLKKAPRIGSDSHAILVGAVMAITQLAYAAPQEAGSDSARDALHQMLDFAWLQCVGMAMANGDMN